MADQSRVQYQLDGIGLVHQGVYLLRVLELSPHSQAAVNALEAHLQWEYECEQWRADLEPLDDLVTGINENLLYIADKLNKLPA